MDAGEASRCVVILCGPAGAGKTTAAHASGMTVYDRDDPEWVSEKHFTSKLAELAHDPQARAVVIRSAATSSARAKARQLVAATATYVVLADPKVCRDRVIQRGRDDMVRGAAAVGRWFESFDRADGIQDFPGWPAVFAAATTGITSREW